MKALFLESYAAGQIAAYAQKAGLDADGLASLLENAYQNGEKHPNHYGRASLGLSYEDWWVSLCLKGDLHKGMTVNGLMNWELTPEGHAFWRDVYRLKPLAEKL